MWSDRNKAAGALMALSDSRAPQLLATLRNEALAPLAEMARWESDGHATAAFLILGRIAGYSDAGALRHGKMVNADSSSAPHWQAKAAVASHEPSAGSRQSTNLPIYEW